MDAKVELLSPAGDWASLLTAVDAGADAVYFGVKGFNMRHAASNFDVLELPKIMERLRSAGKKGYLALNIIIFDSELEKARKTLEAAKRARVDAVILWDMAVFSIARDLGLRVHLSTQASVSNFEAVKAYSELGAKRIVLARECTLRDIGRMARAIIKEEIPVELEAFVHGAMCVSISGRCFLSQYAFGRSANRGDCLQPCRREYAITETDPDGETEYLLGEDYILSPRDLCTITFLDGILDAGVTSLKIEGRMRSPEYVGTVTSCYREAIDAYREGVLTDSLKAALLEKLKQSFNRGFSSGFCFGQPKDLGGVTSGNYEKTYIGEVVKFYRKINVAEIKLMCAGVKKGDRLLIYGKTTPASFMEVGEMELEHQTIEQAEKGTSVGLKIPFTVRRNDKVFIWREKGD